MKKGFTLIELLVVVLIIGILAAVALPMYTRHKGRAARAEAVTILSTLREMQKVHLLEHGQYSTLEGVIPVSKHNNIWCSPTTSAKGEPGGSCYADSKSKNNSYRIILYFADANTTGNKVANKICCFTRGGSKIEDACNGFPKDDIVRGADRVCF